MSSSGPLDWTSVLSTAVIFGVGVIAGALFRRSNPSSSNPLEKFINPLDARKLKLAAIRASNPSRSHKMVMVVRNDLGMGKGKIAAQCAHAAVMCYQKAKVTHEKDLDIWEATGCTKICLKCDDGEEGLRLLKERAKEKDLVTALVHDAGHTQVYIVSMACNEVYFINHKNKGSNTIFVFQVAAGTATVLGIGPAPSEDLSEVTSKLKLL